MAHTDNREDQEAQDRRKFLGKASKAAMVAGIVGGYGGFAAISLRYLYPTNTDDRLWLFVIETNRMRVGESIRYRGPSGETINITRQARTGDADDFIALSSVCPHLGCQVRWEAQNNRFYCPCHNGVFDPSGVATSGPPGDAGQSLSRYDLKVENGLLSIAVPPNRLAGAEQKGEILAAGDDISGPGHDPCLSCQQTPDTRMGSGGDPRLDNRPRRS
ncbi:MAG: Rieske (2Fe-2S) protein [Gemmatimonadota bacterium]|nr:MAG: Rieske (2Fe-2S) protein [Gemmatimonadota bacterium]